MSNADTWPAGVPRGFHQYFSRRSEEEPSFVDVGRSGAPEPHWERMHPDLARMLAALLISAANDISRDKPSNTDATRHLEAIFVAEARARAAEDRAAGLEREIADLRNKLAAASHNGA